MSSHFARMLVAMAAAIVMSTVAVSAAVAPIEVGTAYPLSTAVGATVNA